MDSIFNVDYDSMKEIVLFYFVIEIVDTMG